MRLDGHVLHVEAGGLSRDYDLSRFPRIFVLGFGKASAAMAQAAEVALGSRIAEGLVVIKPGHEAALAGIRQVPGGHPVPDENSVRAARLVAALADKADERTLVIALISGGGSSLVSAPGQESGLTLSDIQETTRALLASGAEIGEVNCIRKHLLLLAGGRLAQRIAPGTCVGIVLSDAVGNDLQTIASGPTSADSTTYGQALSIIESRGGAFPRPVVERLQAGAAGRIPETPKPGAPELSRCSNFLAGTNTLALHAAAREAARLGYNPLVLTARLTGEAREVARVLAAVAAHEAATGALCARPACLLAGGETTVTVRGRGKGGRNQEMAAAFLREMEKEAALFSGVSFLSFSTDGEDGPTDAAGGFALPAMAEAARAAGVRIADALRENDSYALLSELDGLFTTGPTGTNVCDIQVALIT
jgi:glycerate 2-kinase